MSSLRTVALLLGLSTSAIFAATVPRQSPEFVINHPGGKQSLLSNYKGKVVLLQFIFTTCPHCQQTAQLLSKLNKELGPKGFQPLGVAINPMAVMLVNDFIRDYRVNFPVGASEHASALHYLQIGGAERWVVPQVVLIDKKGVIRMQTPPQGDDKMQNEGYLRTQILNLLNGDGTVSKRAASKKPTS
jgi:peroxiredoxin